MSTTASLNLPQLLLVLLVSGIAIRYFFFRPSNTPDPRASFPGSTSRNSRAANPQHVEQIAQMFPQVGRREIVWDLQRNGGSVTATTERILSRGLETPPPSFQPPSLASSSPPSASSSPPAPQVVQQDLIARYNLSSKIEHSQSQTQPPEDSSGLDSSKKTGWSTNKNERQMLMQRRREEMILSARRKMEQKDRKTT